MSTTEGRRAVDLNKMQERINEHIATQAHARGLSIPMTVMCGAAPLDLDAIRAREAAATPGPWVAGDVFGHASVIFNRFGKIVGAGHVDATRCALCPLGEPVWTGRRDINGEDMPAHRHRERHPSHPEHLISSAATGRLVAGNFNYETGGIIQPADTTFVEHARTDIPELLAEVDRLNAVVDAMSEALHKAGIAYQQATTT